MASREKILLAITFVPSRKEAGRIARECVKARLAACASILAPCESTYFWNGKLQRKAEWPVLLKTTAGRYKALERKIREMHSYDLPAIEAFELSPLSAPYARWIEASVR